MKKLLKQHTFPIILLMMILVITLSTQVARSQTAPTLEPWIAPYQIARDVLHNDGLITCIKRKCLRLSLGDSADRMDL